MQDPPINQPPAGGTLPPCDKSHAENRRTEYNAIVGYHTALVTSRFAIAGLLLTGSAFLANAVFQPDCPLVLKLLGSIFAGWLCYCVWVLELRSRQLYTDIGRRGIEIEHVDWGLNGDWSYNGFFSRQYDAHVKNVDTSSPAPPEKSAMLAPKRLGRPICNPDRIRHSRGFDLLYAGSISFWVVAAIVFVFQALMPNPGAPSAPAVDRYTTITLPATTQPAIFDSTTGRIWQPGDEGYKDAKSSQR